jgi:hypothetical protein
VISATNDAQCKYISLYNLTYNENNLKTITMSICQQTLLDQTVPLLQFTISIERLQFPYTSDNQFLISVFRFSLMLYLNLRVCQIASDCGIFKYIFIQISRTKSNFPTSLRYSENCEGSPYRALNSRCCYDVGDSRILEKLSYVFGLWAIE